MFHIKTDIRQYEFESVDKVERLIRNWVIRPSDLIYNAERDCWDPIGQHRRFDEIFSSIDQQEDRQPDTVVTDGPADVARAGKPDADDDTGPVDSQEITNVAEAPERPEDDDTSVGADSSVETAVSASSEEAIVAPPEPPAEVEGVAHDSDEITVMTGKTFDMLRDDAAEDGDGEPKGADEQRPGGGDGEMADDLASSPAVGGGRHGLPEDVFITDEIPGNDLQQAVVDELGTLEEANRPERDRQASRPDESDGAEKSGRAGGEEPAKSGWNIVMADDRPEDARDDRGPGGRRVPDEPIPEADESPPDHPTVDHAARSGGSDKAGLDDATQLVGLAEDKPVDIARGALESVDEPPRDRAKTPIQPVEDPGDLTYQAYQVPLPVDISPSAEDIQMGLQPSRLPRGTKDAVFAYPKPKESGELNYREFDLDPDDPRDHSMLIVALFVIGLLALIIGAATLA